MAARHTGQPPRDPGRCPGTCDRPPETPQTQRLWPSLKTRSGVAMQTTPGSWCRLSRFHRAKCVATEPAETSGTCRRNAAHAPVHTLNPRGATTSSSEQNLDTEPSWYAGVLRAPTVDDDPTSQSNAAVTSKLSFMVAEPNPHEFVQRTVERLLCARVCRRKSARARKWRGPEGRRNTAPAISS